MVRGGRFEDMGAGVSPTGRYLVRLVNGSTATSALKPSKMAEERERMTQQEQEQREKEIKSSFLIRLIFHFRLAHQPIECNGVKVKQLIYIF